MLGGRQGGSQTSQEREWPKAQKQSFAAGLGTCAPGLWSQDGLEGGGGKQALILAENGRWAVNRSACSPLQGWIECSHSICEHQTDEIRNQPVRTASEFLRHKMVPNQPVINLIKTGTLMVNSANLKICIPIKRGPNQT